MESPETSPEISRSRSADFLLPPLTLSPTADSTLFPNANNNSDDILIAPPPPPSPQINSNAAPVVPPTPAANEQREMNIQYTGVLNIWKRSCYILLTFYIPIIASIVAVLAVDWNKNHNGCSNTLNTWLIVLISLYLIMTMLTIRVLIGLPRLTDSTQVQQECMKRIRRSFLTAKCLDCFWFVWFIIGIVWTFTKKCDTSSNVYRLCVALVAIHSILLLLGCCSCCCACCSLLHSISRAAAREEVPGATKHDISKLRKAKYIVDLEGVRKEDTTCAICLQEYELEEEIRFLPCSHHFHSECVDTWLEMHKSCPYCKKLIDEKDKPSSV